MNQKSYSQILDDVARDGIAATDLAPRILARIQKGKSTKMQPRMKMLITAVLLLLVLAIVLGNVPAVRAAIQRWIGYVPGVGLVSDAKIRMLAEPVSVTRDGITLTVEKLWTTADQTLIQYSVQGWARDIVDTKSLDQRCNKDIVLRLPDRELTLSQPQAAIGWDKGYEFKSVYPAIPSTINDVTFVMPCVILALPGEAPENWELALRLVPAPSDITFPVIEISTPVQLTPTVLPQAKDSLPADGISLVLDRAVEMNGSYLIYVTLHYENSGLGWIDIPDPTMLHLLDASGQQISYDLDLDATNAVQAGATPGQTAFAIKTAPIGASGPLTLVLEAVSASIAADANFTFDPGPDPKPEQVWELNQEINLGDGHSLKILKVTYHLADETQAYLSFDIESNTGVISATLFDKVHPLTGTGGGGGGSFTLGAFTSDLYYLEPLPKGPLTVTIVGVSINVPGPWEAKWTPPQP